MIEFEHTTFEQDVSRDIITGLIVNKEFIQKIEKIYSPDFFNIQYVKMVANWCIEYFKAYDKAPGEDIRSIFESKKDLIRDESTFKMIESFLESISDQYSRENFNVEYNVDKAVKFFKNASINRHIEQVKAAQLNGNYEKADSIIASYKKTEKNINMGIDVWTDVEATKQAIDNEQESSYLFKFSGDLGKLIRPFKRKEFIIYMGPGKRGKTWWLIEMAVYASLHSLNVLFISMEMTQEEILIRIHQRTTGMLAPGETKSDGCREILIPTFDRNGGVYQKKEVRNGMDTFTVIKKMSEINNLVNSKFKIVSGPSGSIKASDIRILLTNFEHYDNFIPDIILVDYPDILGKESKGDTREQINETWMILRSISQEYNCLVAAVSHTNKATYDRDIRQGDLSDDARKLNHVTWAAAINQSEEDLDNGCIRMTILADRFKKFNPKTDVMITQCLDVGGICLDSRIIKSEY